MLAVLVQVLAGIVRGLRRPRGRATGQATRILRARTYLLVSIPYFALCAWLWQPIRVGLSVPARSAALGLGAPVYFLGLSLVLWGRLTLGEMYNASSGLGVQLYADHRLITNGPYAFVRHPIYLGIVLAALGGLALYRTWTLVFLLANALGVLALRGRREEEALAAEFGASWAEYSRSVPFVMPRLGP
jgi:protein-S-isoprenylcysteine O-methyltransferase Ste14